MKLREDSSARRKELLIIAVITLGVYLSFRYLLPLVFPFIVAYFIAWIIRPLTEFLYRRLKLSRIVGGTLSLILFTGVISIGLYYLFKILLRQAVAFLRNVPIYLDIIAGKLDSLCRNGDEIFGLSCGTIKKVVDDNVLQTVRQIKSNVIPKITQHSMAIIIGIVGAVGVILIVLVAALLFVKDLPVFKMFYEKHELYRDVQKVTKKLADAGIAYLRCQLIIMVIVAVICVIGLMIMHNNYALLVGMAIAIMDALPILGAGIVFIPWSIIMIINGNIYAAAILITTFLVSQIVREVLEPKLIGNRIGIRPIFTLISMYIGVKLFSFAGFFLGPVGLVIIITIVKVVNEKTGNTSAAEDILYPDN